MEMWNEIYFRNILCIVNDKIRYILLKLGICILIGLLVGIKVMIFGNINLF